MKLKIAIIDYGIGNIRSLKNSLITKNTSVIVTNDSSLILDSDGLILPGVGAFSEGMKNFKKYNLKPVIDEYLDKGKPLLGICLGMQMLFDSSEEFGYCEGIGYIQGDVKKLKRISKLPHISWSEIQPKNINWENSILDKIKVNSDFYFIHSFVPVPKNTDNILSTSNYHDIEFCSSVKKDNIYGTQFHPEKSGKNGMKIMSNFIKICKNCKNVKE